jgi:hypothetical protein
MPELGYYLVALLIPVVVFLIVSRKGRRWYLTLFYGTNISMFVLLIYFVGLGFYFKSFYMGHFDVYPSLHMSRWWMGAVIFLVLPLDLVFLFFYLRNKMYGRKA